MDETKELIEWFEKLTGLKGVPLSTQTKRVEQMLKQKNAPFYWNKFREQCSQRSTEYHEGRNEWWKCNCEKHTYHNLSDVVICSFEYCPLCP